MTCFGCIEKWAVSNRQPHSYRHNSFVINGIPWKLQHVDPDSGYLVDRTAVKRVATTDPRERTIYLSGDLSGSFLRTVLLHELGHATMMSYGLLPAIHSFVKPSRWIEAEEWVCNFIADYGDEVFNIANDILSVENWFSSLLPRYSA